jgi:hypothetical protein
MTEYEIAELAVSTQELYWQQAQVLQGTLEQVFNTFEYFGTLLFGYLMVAYFIGAQLTRVQVGILTTLYLFWVVRLGVVMNIILNGGQITIGEMRKISPDLILPNAPVWGPYAILTFLTLASLYFMWTVRHPKTE